jgi:hypothetical protein
VDREREEDQPEHEPIGLVARQVVVDAVDDDQPEGGEQRHEREQVGVGVGEPDSQVDVGGDTDRQEVAAIEQAEVAKPAAALLDEHRREAGGEQQRDRQQRDQLAVAGASHWPFPPLGGNAPSLRSRSSISETASARERSL